MHLWRLAVATEKAIFISFSQKNFAAEKVIFAKFSVAGAILRICYHFYSYTNVDFFLSSAVSVGLKMAFMVI